MPIKIESIEGPARFWKQETARAESGSLKPQRLVKSINASRQGKAAGRPAAVRSVDRSINCLLKHTNGGLCCFCLGEGKKVANKCKSIRDAASEERREDRPTLAQRPSLRASRASSLLLPALLLLAAIDVCAPVVMDGFAFDADLLTLAKSTHSKTGSVSSSNQRSPTHIIPPPIGGGGVVRVCAAASRPGMDGDQQPWNTRLDRPARHNAIGGSVRPFSLHQLTAPPGSDPCCHLRAFNQGEARAVCLLAGREARICALTGRWAQRGGRPRF